MKMAQPNVAREPSMDEILASIRRIISEDDAPAETASDPAAEAAPEPAPEPEPAPVMAVAPPPAQEDSAPARLHEVHIIAIAGAEDETKIFPQLASAAGEPGEGEHPVFHGAHATAPAHRGGRPSSGASVDAIAAPPRQASPA